MQEKDKAYFVSAVTKAEGIDFVCVELTELTPEEAQRKQALYHRIASNPSVASAIEIEVTEMPGLTINRPTKTSEVREALLEHGLDQELFDQYNAVRGHEEVYTFDGKKSYRLGQILPNVPKDAVKLRYLLEVIRRFRTTKRRGARQKKTEF